jgi:hypothetical protein
LRDEIGRYRRNEKPITEPQKNMITDEKEVPLISYPGISKNLLEIAFLVQNIRPFNQDLIRKQMLFGILILDTHRVQIACSDER